MTKPLTPSQVSFLAALAGNHKVRASNPRLLDPHGEPQWPLIDELTARGFIRQSTRVKGPFRTLWVNLTIDGELALRGVL